MFYPCFQRNIGKYDFYRAATFTPLITAHDPKLLLIPCEPQNQQSLLQELFISRNALYRFGWFAIMSSIAGLWAQNAIS